MSAEYLPGEIVNYKLDDSDDPGSAKVELDRPTGKVILGYKIWKVKVVEVTKQSKLLRAKIGQGHQVSERWFSRE